MQTLVTELELTLDGRVCAAATGRGAAGVEVLVLASDLADQRLQVLAATPTATDGSFVMVVRTSLSPRPGRVPGESTALLVQARMHGRLLASASLGWLEDRLEPERLQVVLWLTRPPIAPQPAARPAARGERTRAPDAARAAAPIAATPGEARSVAPPAEFAGLQWA